jgi:hypothetical protein
LHQIETEKAPKVSFDSTLKGSCIFGLSIS